MIAAIAPADFSSDHQAGVDTDMETKFGPVSVIKSNNPVHCDLHRQNSGAAIGFVQGLLAENQHPLPEKLLNSVRKACDEWQTGARETATADLASAMKVARELSY